MWEVMGHDGGYNSLPAAEVRGRHRNFMKIFMQNYCIRCFGSENILPENR